jgi:hypothetical protein
MPAQSQGARPPQDPEHVVLSRGYSIRLEHLLELIYQQVGGPDDVELTLLVKAPERLILLQLLPEICPFE